MRWIDPERWRACNVRPIDEAALAGRRCYGGLDLASTTDIAALVWTFPPAAVYSFATTDEAAAGGAAASFMRFQRPTGAPSAATSSRSCRTLGEGPRPRRVFAGAFIGRTRGRTR